MKIAGNNSESSLYTDLLWRMEDANKKNNRVELNEREPILRAYLARSVL